MNPIKGKFVRLQNDEVLKGRNAAGTADVNILKVNTSDQVELSVLPVFNDGVDFSEVATEKYVDGESSIIDTRIDNHVNGLAEKHSSDDINEGTTNLFFTDSRARTAAVADSIADGVANIAPSQNAVFDALALKANLNLGNATDTSIPAGVRLTSLGTSQVQDATEFAVATSDQTASNSGNVKIRSGAVSTGTGLLTGSVRVTAGTNSNASAASASALAAGLVTLSSGGITGGTQGSTGNATVISGSISGTHTHAGNTGVAQILSGSLSTSGVGSTGNTGILAAQSGNISNANITGNTGDAVLLTGSNSGVGNSGIATVRSGEVGGTGNSGQVNLLSGRSASGTSGTVLISSGEINASLPGYPGGIANGSNTSATGALTIRSGQINNASSSAATGIVNLASGNNAGSGASGALNLSTGNNSGIGDSGAISISTGTTASGSRGAVSIAAGSVSITSANQVVVNPTTTLSMSSKKIVDLADPTLAQDAATKSYIDSSVSNKALTDLSNLVSPTAIPAAVGLTSLSVDQTLSAGFRITTADQTSSVSGRVAVASGTVAGNFVSGPGSVSSGDSTSASMATATTAATGLAALVSGNITGGTQGSTGGVAVQSGTIPSGVAGSTGTVQVVSGSNSGTGNTGGAVLQSGSVLSGATGSTGGILVNTGINSGTGVSGGISMSTGSSVTAASGSISTVTGKSVNAASGSMGFSTGAINSTGLNNATTSTATGNVNINSGDIGTGATASTATTGNVNLRSGSTTGLGVSGNLNLNSGASTNASSTANTGTVNVNSGTVSGAGASGNTNFGSGVNSGTGASGATSVSSGSITNLLSTAATGSSQVITGNNAGLGDTGTVGLFSGQVQNAASAASTGQVSIISGNNAGTGNSGPIFIGSGSVTSGARGNVTLSANELFVDVVGQSGALSVTDTGTSIINDLFVNTSSFSNFIHVKPDDNYSQVWISRNPAGSFNQFGSFTAQGGSAGVTSFHGGRVEGTVSGQFSGGDVQLESNAQSYFNDTATDLSIASGNILLQTANGFVRGSLYPNANSGNLTLRTGLAQGAGARGKLDIQTSFTDMNSTQIVNLADPSANQHAATKKYVDDQGDLKVSKAGDTMSGFLTLHANPTADFHAATKKYVDVVAEGLHIHAPCRLVRTTQVVGTYTNGASGVGAKITPTSAVSNIDGTGSFSIGQRIMINGQSNQWENGIYTVSAVDGSNHVTEFTRATDFDTSAEVAGGDFVFVQSGSNYANTGWVETRTTTALGFGVSDPIEFVQFSGAGSYSAGEALELDGTTFNVLYDNATIVVQGGTNKLMVADGGIEELQLADDSVTRDKINANVAGQGLSQDVNGALSAPAGDGLTHDVSDFLSVDAPAIAGQGLEDDGANNLKIKLLPTATGGLDFLPSDELVLASSIAGPGLNYSTGVLNVMPDNTSIFLNPSDEIEVATMGITADKLNSNVVAFEGGLSQDLDGALQVNVGTGLQLITGFISVYSDELAGDGLEADMANKIQIKSEYVTVPDISVSSGGLSIVNRWYKEQYAISTTLTSGAYYDLDFEAEPGSLDAYVDRLAIHEGASFDFTLSTVGGVTRVTFLNTLVTSGQQQLTSGDTVFFKYQKKAS
jgi:hypothetical protein